MKHLRVAIFLFNFVIWLAGFMVVGVGAWLLLEPSNGHLLNLFVNSTTPHDTINTLAYSFLGLGFVILIVGFLGCRVSLYATQCVLITYIFLLVGLIGTELTTAAVGGFMAYRGLSGLETRLLERLADHYGHDRTSDGDFTQSLDYAQYKFNCCGIYSDDDYNGTAWWRDGILSGTKRQVPLTCCVLKNHDVKNAGSPMSVVSRVFHKDNEIPWLRPEPRDEMACQATSIEAHRDYRNKIGCMDRVRLWLRFESLKLVFIGMGMAVVQTIGIVASAILYRNIRDEEGV